MFDLEDMLCLVSVKRDVMTVVGKQRDKIQCAGTCWIFHNFQWNFFAAHGVHLRHLAG